jgi:hypothetical protein
MVAGPGQQAPVPYINETVYELVYFLPLSCLLTRHVSGWLSSNVGQQNSSKVPQ